MSINYFYICTRCKSIGPDIWDATANDIKRHICKCGCACIQITDEYDKRIIGQDPINGHPHPHDPERTACIYKGAWNE